MTKITFTAPLTLPNRHGAWIFCHLPKPASAKLPARGRVSVRGTINGFAFRTSAFPNGKGSHVISVNKSMQEGAGAKPGQKVRIALEPETAAQKVSVPADLRRAVSASSKASATFAGVTPNAKQSWVTWIEQAKQTETRRRRVAESVKRLAAGKRRPDE